MKNMNYKLSILWVRKLFVQTAKQPSRAGMNEMTLTVNQLIWT